MWVGWREERGGAREEGWGRTEEVDWEEEGGKAEKALREMRYWKKVTPKN